MQARTRPRAGATSPTDAPAGTRPIAAPLLAWFRERGRAALPWRTDRAPYRIVVAEFMLQQTQVDRVVPRFERFVARWPDFAALAAAAQADVVREWQGLGYNSRAVRLHGLARAVRDAHGGELPRALGTLLALPGVGAYTARAIAAFAFDADVVAADVNVRRIVHRTQLGFERPPLASDAELDARALALAPPGEAFAFNSALMDLGATLCTARAPKCLLCPLRAACAAAPLDAAALAARLREHAPRRGPQAAMRFESTTRYLRGRVVDALRALPPGERISLLDLRAAVAPHFAPGAEPDVAGAVAALARDALVASDDAGVGLA